jgi:hypothetical protein
MPANAQASHASAATDDRLWVAAAHRVDSFYAVAISPDGSLVASGSDDSTVKLWDVTTGQLLRMLEGHQEAVLSVSFSGDGRVVASGSDDGTVKLWDATTGQLLHSLEGHQDWVRSVSFSGDGRVVGSGSSDGTVKLWAAGTGQLLRTLEGLGYSHRTPDVAVPGRWLFCRAVRRASNRGDQHRWRSGQRVRSCNRSWRCGVQPAQAYSKGSSLCPLRSDDVVIHRRRGAPARGLLALGCTAVAPTAAVDGRSERRHCTGVGTNAVAVNVSGVQGARW